MIKLEAGNVLLKPSHRKQVMAWLRRVVKLGQRMGNFVLTVTLHRSGKVVEAHAIVHDSAGDFGVKARETDWFYAMRDLVRALAARLNMQRLALG